MTVLREDFFDLPDELHGQFDYVLEYTCFCAISPERRFEYDRVIWQLLKPKGKLLGLFFPLDKDIGEGTPRVDGDYLPDLSVSRFAHKFSRPRPEAPLT